VSEPREGIAVLDAATGPALAIVEGDGSAHAIVWPGTGARLRSLARIRLAPGARTVTLRHPEEAVYYVIEGRGSVAEGAGAEASALVPGTMVHVDAGTDYVITAGEPGIDLVGGPSPADPALYERAAEGG
jgi:mannose-6-phosphate isomerase-like protein (cupin superfamily)